MRGRPLRGARRSAEHEHRRAAGACGAASRSSASTGSRSGTTSTRPTPPATRTASKRSPRTPRSRRRPNGCTCGSLVYSAGYRHPAVLANAMATLDQVADGRVVLGLGGGWLQQEYDVYGIPYGTPGERLRKLERVHPVRARAAHAGAHDLRRRVLHAARRAVRTQAGAGAAADLDRRRRREGDVAHLRASTPTAGTCRSSRPTCGRTRRKVLDEHCERLGRDPGDDHQVASTSAWRSPTRSCARSSARWRTT